MSRPHTYSRVTLEAARVLGLEVARAHAPDAGPRPTSPSEPGSR